MSEQVRDKPNQPNYCYSFKKIYYKGFGARIYEILLAYHYCRINNIDLNLIKGETWNLLKNKQTESGDQSNDWHQIFKSVPNLLDQSLVNDNYTWPKGSIGKGWTCETPNDFPGPRIVWYSKLIKEIFQLQPEYEKQVRELIKQSGFKPTDIVIHLRLSDKVKLTRKNAVPESAEVEVSWYTNEAIKYIRSIEGETDPEKWGSWRVFVCTDDPAALEKVEELFKEYSNVTVVWDPNEIRRNGYIPKFFDGEVSEKEAKDENLTALKNIQILADSAFLVGSRASYFFRVGELLHYPKPSVNVKDSDKFGPAEYEENIPHVRKSQLKAYATFINPKWSGLDSENNLSEYAETLKKDGIVSIPDIIKPEIAEKLHDFLHNKMPANWYSSAHLPNNKGGYTPQNIPGTTADDDPVKKELIKKAQDHRSKGLFSYYFYRTFGGHYKTCYCGECRLRDSINSYEFRDLFAKLIGKPVTKLGEVFISKYQKGCFLTKHHDKKKGRYAFTISFNKDWDPGHGGLLHFWDEKTKNIYKTSVPGFNCLTIFYIPEDDEGYLRDHFVTEVVGPSKRITLTGWVS